MLNLFKIYKSVFLKTVQERNSITSMSVI